jgi:hypothetical protein
VDINHKHEPYAARNPFCFHTHLPSPSVLSPIDLAAQPPFFLDQEDKDSWYSPHAQDTFSDVGSSRLLSAELKYVGNVSTLAGVALSAGSTNGIGSNSRFNWPPGVSISPDGISALITDQNNHLIRKIILSTASVLTLAGAAGSAGSTNGMGTNSKFFRPIGISISPNGVYALVGDGDNHLIRQIILSTASVSTLAGVSESIGSTNGIGTNSKFNGPTGICISPDGVYALIADFSNHLIRQIIISTASVSTLAGVAAASGSTDGIGTNSQFRSPAGVCISPDGLFALVADFSNNLIRKIVITTATVSTLTGVALTSGSTNGIGTTSKFNGPAGVCISPDGLNALVADYSNHLIRQIILSTASVSTLAGVSESPGATNGIGTNSKFNKPYGITIFPNGLFALVADNFNSLIRQIFLTTASVAPSALPSAFPSSVPSPSPSSMPSLSPSSVPSLSPSSVPSVSAPPTIPLAAVFSFGVKISDEGIHSGKAILVDYLRDKRRGKTLLSLSLHSLIFFVCFSKDVSYLSHRQRLSSLLSFRPSLIL